DLQDRRPARKALAGRCIRVSTARSPQKMRKINRKPDLASHARACLIPAAQDAKGNAESVIQCVTSSGKSLHLITPQTAGIGKPPVDLAPKRQLRSEVVCQG